MCLCCGLKFSQGIALAVIGLVMLFIGVGGAIGFIYWDKHGGARATYWVGVGFIVFGCLGLCFLLLALGLAIWACYKESNRHKGGGHNVVVAPAPAPPPPQPVVHPAPQPVVQAPVSHQVHHHHYPPPQPAYYSPPPANYYPPAPEPYYAPPAAYDPNANRPHRHGDPSSALDTSVTM